MLPNPGGRLAPDQIVGRNREIERYWQILRRQGLVLAAERRIGKTSIVSKMCAFPAEGFLPIYQDLEHVHRVMELVRSVYLAIDRHLKLPLGKALKARARSAWVELLPKKIQEIDLPDAATRWKDLLRGSIDDALSIVPAEGKLLFVWDEFPLMLFNLRKLEGPGPTIQLLDLLRSLRQEHSDSLRFLFTGSVGLHLVLRELHADKNANAPVNDMYAETVPPMSEDDALELCRTLLVDEVHAGSDVEALARRLYLHASGFPFHLQHSIDRLLALGRVITPPDVDDVVTDLIRSDQDPAQFAFHAQRLKTYYPTHEVKLARAVLGALAHHRAPLDHETLLDRVRHQIPDSEAQAVRDICDLLRQDHYLTRILAPGRNEVAFRWPLLERWWRETQL